MTGEYMDKKQHHYQVLKRKILASMLLTPLIPFALATIVSFYYFSHSIRANTVSKMEQIVENHARLVDSFLQERKADLDFVADSYTFEELRQEKNLTMVFENLQKKSNAFVDLGVFDETGYHVAYHGPYQLAGKMYGSAQWFFQVMMTGSYVSDIFAGYRKVPHFIIAIAREENKRKWVLRATIDPNLFAEVVEQVRMGKTGEAYILNRDGVFQTLRRSGGRLMEKALDASFYLTPHESTRVYVSAESQEEYLCVTTWLSEKQWLLVARQETVDAFAALRYARFLVLLIAALGGAIMVALAFYVTNRITDRIKSADREKDQLNQQLVVAGRLAEIGEMSSGFAHEINNPLQVISAETALIEVILPELKERGELIESDDSRDVEGCVDQIKLQVERCAKITSAILKFARHKDMEPQVMELCEFLPEITRMVAKKAELDGIILDMKMPDAPLKVSADPSELQQVLLNLLNNAIYAIVERHGSQGGGELTLKCESHDNHAVISVIDNGAGITPENMEKIFTPFFSTKPVGQGTGLGLSICFGIIEKMGGTIEVKGEKNIGTEFIIRLPEAA